MHVGVFRQIVDLSIPNCPIKVDFEIGPSWGELEELIKILSILSLVYIKNQKRLLLV
jgi:hypothetical protein